MGRIGVVVLLVLGVAASACRDQRVAGCNANADCSAGQICLDGSCESICQRDADCGAGSICRDQVCQSGVRDTAPQIVTVDGTGTAEDGSVDPRGARTAHHLRQNVIVNGTNLEGSTVQLAPEASAAITLNIAESSQDRLVAVLPENVIEGHYSLQVANAVGTDQVEVWLLRGETGEQGAPRTAAEVLTLLQSLGDPVPGLHAESAERSESLTDASGGAHTWAEIVGGAVPAGATMMFARNTCPSGWIPADGQAVSRATYAVLFAAIGVSFGVGDGVSTFTLPDLRGEFVRGWDDGRGADGGRSFASGQGSATRLLMNTYFSAENGLPGAVGDSAYGMITHSPGTFWAGLDFQPSGPSVYTVKRSASPAMDSTFGNATETRPRNVALLACIKS